MRHVFWDELQRDTALSKHLTVGALCAVTLMMGRVIEAQDNPFLGCWALTPKAGGAGWLEVRQGDGLLEGTLLWMRAR